MEKTIISVGTTGKNFTATFAKILEIPGITFDWLPERAGNLYLQGEVISGAVSDLAKDERTVTLVKALLANDKTPTKMEAAVTIEAEAYEIVWERTAEGETPWTCTYYADEWTPDQIQWFSEHTELEIIYDN